jgi:hypothetical protein
MIMKKIPNIEEIIISDELIDSVCDGIYIHHIPVKDVTCHIRNIIRKLLTKPYFNLLNKVRQFYIIRKKM